MTAQKPEPVCLGSEWEWQIINREKKLKEIQQFGYYIDVFSTINVSLLLYIILLHTMLCCTQALLTNPFVKEGLLSLHKSIDDIRRDYCDGEFFKNHPVFSVHSNALQFILYYDDIEVANALGLRAGSHKLGTTAV